MKKAPMRCYYLVPRRDLDRPDGVPAVVQVLDMIRYDEARVIDVGADWVLFCKDGEKPPCHKRMRTFGVRLAAVWYERRESVHGSLYYADMVRQVSRLDPKLWPFVSGGTSHA